MIQVPLDNLRKSRQYLAEKVLNLVQSFYTEERVIMVTNELDPLKPREPIAINQPTPEGQIINDLTLGEYDVIISTQPARDSYDEMQFAEAINLRQAGVMIPDDAIIEYSHLGKKGELAKRIRSMTGQEPPTPEQAEAMQVQQQIQMQQLSLEIAKLEAEVAKLQSEAAVNMAKAQDVGSISPQLKAAELQTKAEIEMQQIQLRRDLADLTNQTRIGQAETSAATKIAATAMNVAARSDKPNPQPITNNRGVNTNGNNRNGS